MAVAVVLMCCTVNTEKANHLSKSVSTLWWYVTIYMQVNACPSVHSVDRRSV